MRAILVGLLIALVLVSSDGPRRLVDPVRGPANALADRDPRRGQDDDDRDEGKARKNGKGKRESSARDRDAGAPGVLALTRGPYLQVGTPTTITIRWRTSEPCPSRVRYGPSPDRLEFEAGESGPTREHEVRLADLDPETRYYYSVGTPTSELAGGPDCSFRTAPPAGADRKVRIWMIGDSGLRGSAQQRVQGAYGAYAAGADPDVWILLGDNAYTAGTSAQYQAGFFGPFQTRLRSTVVWPARGNHDVIKQGPGNDYFDFFTLPSEGEGDGTPSGTEAYFSFDYANIHFVCLDAERLESGAGSRMIDWLRADLAATDQDWVIAYWHHPPYSKGSHDSDTDAVMSEARRRFLPVLEEGGADLVACGHSHSYERSHLLDGHYGPSISLERSMILDQGTGDPARNGPYRKTSFGSPAPHEGTVYVVVGSSSKLSGGRLDHPAHAKSLNVLGSLAIEISGNRLDAAFVDDRRRVADRFTILKGEGPAAQRGGRAAGLRPRGGHVVGRGDDR